MTPLDLLSAFDSVADAPEGIKRLRELVLQLAIRGKLVTQDPADEPASVLLDRIAKEKACLVAEGKARKDRAAPKHLDPPPFEIPSGWAWTTTTALGFVNPRNNASDATAVSFAPMPVVPVDFRERLKPESRLWGEIKKGYTHVADGDVVVAKITPCFQNEKSCVMEGLMNGIGAGTTELMVLRPVAGLVNPRYLLAFYKSPEFIHGGIATMTGTAGQQRVAGEYFAYRPLPLPPLSEQHRIVARVDELMGLLDRLDAAHRMRSTTRVAARDAALASLREASSPDEVEAGWNRVAGRLGDFCVMPEDVKPLRLIVLELAVRGRLVEQDKSDESAEHLLARVTAQRAADVRPGKRNAIVLVPTNEQPHRVPFGWAWCRVADVGEVKLGRQRSPENHLGPHMVPYLRVANVHEARLDLSDVKTMNFTPEEQKTFALQPGDVLLNEGQSRELVGRPAIYRGEVPGACFQNTLLRFRTFECVLPEFALIVFRRCMHTGRFVSASQQTTNIAHLSAGRLAPVEFPLPPLAEQRRIVAKVDELMGILERLEVKLREVQQTQAAFSAAAVHYLDADATEATNGFAPAA